MISVRRPRHLAAKFLFGVAMALGPACVQAGQVAQASQLLGRYVVDARGNTLGEMRDFVVDMKEGRAVFALIWAPGRQGGGRFVTYPLPAKMTFDGNRLSTEATREQIAALPGFGPGEEPDYAGPEFAPLMRPAAAGNEKNTWPGDDTGPRYMRATKITELEVKQPAGGRAGAVRDTMFDLETGQLNLVFEFDPGWYKGVAGFVAMPPQSTKRQGAQLIATFDPKDMKPAAPEAPKGDAPAAGPPPNPLDRDFRVTSLIGSGVWDTKGQEVAKIADLMVDSSTGRVTEAILAVGARQVAFPLPPIGATVTNDHLVLDIARDKLEALPAPQADASGKVRRASELTSTTRLFDSRSIKVGELRDLVVNLSTAKVHYAVLEFDPNWVQAGMLVAMPLREIAPSKDRNQPGLAMRAELNELNRGMVIQKNAWPDFNSPQYKQIVGQYFK